MKERSTADLGQELMSSSDLDTYLAEHRDCFTSRNVAELLNEIYREKPFSKAELARRAGMSEVYLHQVFSARRNPSRDRLLCLCAGLEVTLEETQRLLKQAGYAQLYMKNKRDAIIAYGLSHNMWLSDINDKLFSVGEKTLL